MLVNAILPKKPKPFAMSIPTPSYAIRFLDAKGELIYETSLCLDEHYIQMVYPRYLGRVGIDAKIVRQFLTKYGLLKSLGKKPKKIE